MVHLCSQCGFRGKDNYHLKRHRMIHTGEKPFTCDYCPYDTNNKYHLTRHLKVHDQSKTIVCDAPDCNYRFATVAALERHRIQHNRAISTAKGSVAGFSGSHICKHCDFRAVRKAMLTQHIQEAHDESASPAPLQGQEVAGECVICQDDEATFMCMPCGHQCVCGSPQCTSGIMRNRICPMCHQVVKALGRASEVRLKFPPTSAHTDTKEARSPDSRASPVAQDIAAVTATAVNSPVAQDIAAVSRIAVASLSVFRLAPQGC
eukprot:m.431094 g.431094  ORF g.431094 m.431094 type:complete len:262 (+) comp17257_c0_seq1:89-874(+)